jgi:N-acetylmuramic acid 6-phosphate (MurNAc-6-P) etherase
MTEHLNEAGATDEQMRYVLEALLANDDDITARAVARLHPAISAASSITRSPARVNAGVKLTHFGPGTTE